MCEVALVVEPANETDEVDSIEDGKLRGSCRTKPSNCIPILSLTQRADRSSKGLYLDAWDLGRLTWIVSERFRISCRS